MSGLLRIIPNPNHKGNTLSHWKVKLHGTEKCSGKFYIVWMSVMLMRQLPDETRDNKS